MEQIILLEEVLGKSMPTHIKTFIVINNNKTLKLTFLLRIVLGLLLFDLLLMLLRKFRVCF